MDFRQLETFVEVAKLKSFSKAAEKLFITQPTVTNHIQNLEKELGTLLINRLGKTITLTYAGNLLYTYAINILNTCDKARFELATYKGKIQGHIHIYSSSVPRNFLLPKIIKSFLTIYPDVTFTIGHRDSKKVIKSILDGETDFGILGAKYSSNNIKYLDLMDDELVLITPNTDEFPDDNFSFIDKEILYKERFIFREEGSGTRALVEEVLQKSKVQLDKVNIVSYVEDANTLIELVSLGIGLSFISKRAIKSDLEIGKYKAFYIKDLSFTRKFYFAYHKNRQLSPLNEKFRDFMLKNTKDQEI
ncbi:MAG: LysR family transcriptional regulator [Tissierellia bacterium]|nr:LysR family transcriptional regulator [Tissierellia bacterium]